MIVPWSPLTVCQRESHASDSGIDERYEGEQGKIYCAVIIEMRSAGGSASKKVLKNVARVLEPWPHFSSDDDS